MSNPQIPYCIKYSNARRFVVAFPNCVANHASDPSCRGANVGLVTATTRASIQWRCYCCCVHSYCKPSRQRK